MSAENPNPIEIENSLPGTTDWEIEKINVSNGEIEGYASKTSVNAGEEIEFYVNTYISCGIHIYRLGYYGGVGGREMTIEGVIPTTIGKDENGVVGQLRQRVPRPEPDSDGMVECEWDKPFTLKIPSDWVSGVYVAKLITDDYYPADDPQQQKASYIHFVVRDDSRQADHLFQCSVTTYQAYNKWGEKSLYDFNSSDNKRAVKVSFNRPYEDGQGTGQFFSYEYAMLRFLEREGFDVSYCTNIDVHENPDKIFQYKSFLSIGHDEYWSWEMRNNVEQARDSSVSAVNLAFFSANTCYWQIRMESSLLNGRANRTMVCYKDSSKDTIEDRNLTTVQWRQSPVNRPENALLGIMFDYSFYPVDNNQMIVSNSTHWIFRDTGVSDGSSLGQLLGYEGDRIFDSTDNDKDSPAGLIPLCISPVSRTIQTEPIIQENTGKNANMTIYKTNSNIRVFAAGTIQWSSGLDDYTKSSTGINISLPAQQITRNLLNVFNGTLVPEEN
jgi:hypothetical protein